jgi:hypothetical protein
MLAPSDLIRLPYTPDLTPTGIAYACRSLPYTYDRMGGSNFSRLRRIVAGKAVELAFRRYLGAEDVPYDDLGATPFTDPDHYDIGLGGRRCDLKSFLLSQKDTIHRIRRNPDHLLQASALVPTDQVASDHLNDDDLYIFAFVTALVTPHQVDLERAMAAGQPHFILFSLPSAWARPPHWISLGQLIMKSEASQPITVELGGQGADRDFQSEEIALSPGIRTRAQKDFYSLAYLHVPHIPAGRIGVHSTRMDRLCIVHPHEWGNIWVYGMDIFLGGYMTRGEFRRRAADLPPGSRVMQYFHTRTHNQTLFISDLYPLFELFSRVKQWGPSPV